MPVAVMGSWPHVWRNRWVVSARRAMWGLCCWHSGNQRNWPNFEPAETIRERTGACPGCSPATPFIDSQLSYLVQSSRQGYAWSTCAEYLYLSLLIRYPLCLTLCHSALVALNNQLFSLSTIKCWVALRGAVPCALMSQSAKWQKRHSFDSLQRSLTLASCCWDYLGYLFRWIAGEADFVATFNATIILVISCASPPSASRCFS